MLVVYVDDVGIAAKRPEDVDKVVKRLELQGFQLTRKGSLSEFFGIKFETNAVDRSVYMTQKRLIKNIIEPAGMTDCNRNWTPASSITPLGLDPDGEPMEESWSYRSIVGMLLYLTTNTCPALGLCVSQITRFNHAPEKSHSTAVKTIIRYLHRTANKGMIVSVGEDISPKNSGDGADGQRTDGVTREPHAATYADVVKKGK
jgi:hypothetical protein